MIVKSFVRQPFCVISIIVMVQYPHYYEQNLSRIACGDALLFYISQILHFLLYLHLT